MMTMMNGFTVLRLLTMAGGMMNVKFTKEDLLKLNTRLNRIKQPRKKRQRGCKERPPTTMVEDKKEYKKVRKSLVTSGFFGKSRDIFFGATSQKTS